MSNEQPVNNPVARRVFDYLTKHNVSSPRIIGKELGVDVKQILAALNELKSQGRVVDNPMRVPQPPRVVLPRPSDIARLDSWIGGIPQPPRTVPPRLPANKKNLAHERILEAREQLSRTKKKQKEQVQRARAEQLRIRDKLR